MNAADQAVRDLAAVCGVPFGHYTTVSEPPPDIPGGYGGEADTRYCVERKGGGFFVTLPGGLVADHNPAYGGYVIEQIAPTGRTWVSRPFKQERLSSRPFCAYVTGLIEAISDDPSLADHVRRDLPPEAAESEAAQ